MTSRRPGGDEYNDFQEDNTYLIDRNSDRKGSKGSRRAPREDPQMHENFDKFFDNGSREYSTGNPAFSMPDTTTEVDPTTRGQFSEEDFSSKYLLCVCLTGDGASRDHRQSVVRLFCTRLVCIMHR